MHGLHPMINILFPASITGLHEKTSFCNKDFVILNYNNLRGRCCRKIMAPKTAPLDIFQLEAEAN